MARQPIIFKKGSLNAIHDGGYSGTHSAHIVHREIQVKPIHYAGHQQPPVHTQVPANAPAKKPIPVQKVTAEDYETYCKKLEPLLSQIEQGDEYAKKEAEQFMIYIKPRVTPEFYDEVKQQFENVSESYQKIHESQPQESHPQPEGALQNIVDNIKAATQHIKSITTKIILPQRPQTT